MITIAKKHKNAFQFYSRLQLSKMTIKNYTTAVIQFLEYIDKNHLNMSFQSIRDWLETFENALTYNFKLQGVKAYFLKYFEHETADKILELEHGFKRIKRKKAKCSVDDSRYITFHEYKKLISVNTIAKLKSYCHHKHELSGYTDDN